MLEMRKKSKVFNAEEELSYRMPMKVEEEIVFLNGHAFSVCPRCKISMEREYQSYCDRCGQCLDWSDFRNAKKRWVLPSNMVNGEIVSKRRLFDP